MCTRQTAIKTHSNESKPEGQIEVVAAILSLKHTAHSNSTYSNIYIDVNIHNIWVYSYITKAYNTQTYSHTNTHTLTHTSTCTSHTHSHIATHTHIAQLKTETATKKKWTRKREANYKNNNKNFKNTKLIDLSSERTVRAIPYIDNSNRTTVQSDQITYKLNKKNQNKK